MDIRADQVQTILAQWPDTALGKLFADEVAIAAAKLGIDHTYNKFQRDRAVILAAQQLELPERLQPWQVRQLIGPPVYSLWRLLEHPAREVQSAEACLMMDPERGTRGDPWIVRSMSCSPKFEGRWTAQFEAEARARGQSRLFKQVADAKIDGFPAHTFVANLTEDQQDDLSDLLRGQQQWMLHMPGQFVYGYGPGDKMGKVDAAPARPNAEISMEIDWQQFVKGLETSGRGVPGDFVALGFDNLKQFRWSGHFDDGMLVDSLEVEFVREPSGITGALVAGEGQPPKQALPKGALAQLRTKVNVENLLTEFARAQREFQLPTELFQNVVAAFDGGLAIACCEPPIGGLIPRLYATLSIQDEAALDGLLALLDGSGIPTKKRKLRGVEVTTLKIPDAPQGLQPSWCRIGNQLHIAESALSMRAFLKAQESGAVAMDVDGMEAPGGAGELQPNLDLRFDAAAIYKNFYETWLPLFELSMGSEMQSPVQRADLPEPEIVAEYLGKGRGVLRREGNRYSLIQQSASGGLETTALLFCWSTMMTPEIMQDNTVDQMSRIVAEDKLEKVYEKLERFKQREQRWPKDLAEFYTAEKLADDALLLPADDLAETITLPDGRTVRSSFRYYPTPIKLAIDRPDHEDVLMVEIRPSRWERTILAVTGSTPSMGYQSRLPIDQVESAGAAERKRRQAAGRIVR